MRLAKLKNTESIHKFQLYFYILPRHALKIKLKEQFSFTISSKKFFKINFTKEIQNYTAVLSHSVISDSVTTWTVAHQPLLSMGIHRARILEWVAMPSSRGSSQPRD